jgi:hypothetical protein
VGVCLLWAVFGENYRSRHFYATFYTVALTEENSRATIWRFFCKSHLVTLNAFKVTRGSRPCYTTSNFGPPNYPKSELKLNF